jgi:hypothetical protein
MGSAFDDGRADIGGFSCRIIGCNVDDLGQLIEMMRVSRPAAGRQAVEYLASRTGNGWACRSPTSTRLYRRAGCATLVDVCKWHYSDPFGIAPGRANSVCC